MCRIGPPSGRRIDRSFANKIGRHFLDPAHYGEPSDWATPPPTQPFHSKRTNHSSHISSHFIATTNADVDTMNRNNYAGGEGVHVPIMIVGNKCDEENNREVKKELASKMVSESMKDSGHMETSAKLNLNVQQAFQVSALAGADTNKTRC